MNAGQIVRFLFLYKLYSLKELNQKNENKSINPRRKKKTLNLRDFPPQNHQ